MAITELGFAVRSGYPVVGERMENQGQAPLPKRKWKGNRTPPPGCYARDGQHNPLAVREFGDEACLPPPGRWWAGGKELVSPCVPGFAGPAPSSRTPRLREQRTPSAGVAADRVARKRKPNRPSTGYRLCPADTPLADLVRLAKQRWIIERDYEELKQELGLGHYEGRGLARLSPSCDSLYCGLWVSWWPNGSRFFPLPLAPVQVGLTRRRNAAQVPPSGFAPSTRGAA